MKFGFYLGLLELKGEVCRFHKLVPKWKVKVSEDRVLMPASAIEKIFSTINLYLQLEDQNAVNTTSFCTNLSIHFVMATKYNKTLFHLPNSITSRSVSGALLT